MFEPARAEVECKRSPAARQEFPRAFPEPGQADMSNVLADAQDTGILEFRSQRVSRGAAARRDAGSIGAPNS